jgi:hypothetical protein
MNRFRVVLAAVVIAATGTAVPMSYAAGCANVTTPAKDWTFVKAPSLPTSALAVVRDFNGLHATISPVSANLLMVHDSLSVETSIDGGCTWKAGPSLTAPSAALPHDSYSSMVLQAFWAPTPAEPKTAYLVIGSPNNAVFADSPHTSVLRTTDGGSSWSALNLGSAAAGYAPHLAVAPSDPKRLYLSAQYGVVLTAPRVVYASTDSGATWTVKSAFPDLTQRQNTLRLVVDPTVPTTLWASDLGTTPAGSSTPVFVRRSRDGGATWTALTMPTNGSANAGINVTHPAKSKARLVVMGNENQGEPRAVWKSEDDGDTWTTMSAPPHSGPLAPGASAKRLVVGSATTDSVAYRYVATRKAWFGISAPRPRGGGTAEVDLNGMYDSAGVVGAYFTYSRATSTSIEHGIAILRLGNDG